MVVKNGEEEYFTVPEDIDTASEFNYTICDTSSICGKNYVYRVSTVYKTMDGEDFFFTEEGTPSIESGKSYRAEKVYCFKSSQN